YGRKLGSHQVGQPGLIRGHIQEVHGAAGKGCRHTPHDGVAQLPVKLAYAIRSARSAHVLVERFRVRYAVRVNAECAHPHGPKLLVANGNGSGSTPLLIDLQAAGEEVNVRLERRLEGLVPVHQVSKDRKGVRTERMQARA